MHDGMEGGVGVVQFRCRHSDRVWTQMVLQLAAPGPVSGLGFTERALRSEVEFGTRSSPENHINTNWQRTKEPQGKQARSRPGTFHCGAKDMENDPSGTRPLGRIRSQRLWMLFFSFKSPIQSEKSPCFCVFYWLLFEHPSPRKPGFALHLLFLHQPKPTGVSFIIFIISVVLFRSQNQLGLNKRPRFINP